MFRAACACHRLKTDKLSGLRLPYTGNGTRCAICLRVPLAIFTDHGKKWGWPFLEALGLLGFHGSHSMSPRTKSHTKIWVWLKINKEGLRRFCSIFPLTRVPFWYRFFEPQPYVFRSQGSLYLVEMAVLQSPPFCRPPSCQDQAICGL